MLGAYATAQYQEMQVQTSQGKLVVMLYDGAIRFLYLGLDAMRRGDLEQQSHYISRAQNILAHLMATLDMGAGEISHQLASIYRYCIERLLYANAEDRADYVEEVIGHLAPLRDAWEHAERSMRADQPHGAPAPSFALAGAAA